MPGRSRSAAADARRRAPVGRGPGSSREPDPDPELDGEPDPESVARTIALRMLERRPCTRAELAAGLARRGVPDDAATVVLDRFTDVGLLDDAAFATAWVDSRHAGRGLARRALAAELRRRGVDDHTIGEALAGVSDDEEASAARALVTRRLPATAGLPADARIRRLVGMLGRKGFSQGLSVRVVREALAAAGDE